uniref:Putative secreted protein n=1 Tax=Anopheles marajoara TaxID=58244 RepID=A0A2M4C8T7_9DIPT
MADNGPRFRTSMARVCYWIALQFLSTFMLHRSRGVVQHAIQVQFQTNTKYHRSEPQGRHFIETIERQSETQTWRALRYRAKGVRVVPRHKRDASIGVRT